MTRKLRLPSRLRYLESVEKRLAALPSEEVNEDMDTAPFEDALRTRIASLAPEEATKVLREDRDDLQQWLARPGNENNRLHFFYGFLLIAADSVEELLQPSAERDVGELHMDIPTGASFRRHGPVWEGGFAGANLLISPNDKAGFELDVETFNVAATLEKGQATWSKTAVDLGLVKGLKFVRICRPLNHKEVHYALEVPGGCCTAHVTHAAADWPECNLERCFSTIRVTGAP